MKIAFSKEVRFVPTFNDNKSLPDAEQITTLLSPLTLGELLDVLDILRSANFEKGEVKDLSTTQMRMIVSQAGKYLPTNVKRLEGNEGFDLSDVVSYAQFFGLATEIVFELVRISSPSGPDVKN